MISTWWWILHFASTQSPYCNLLTAFSDFPAQTLGIQINSWHFELKALLQVVTGNFELHSGTIARYIVPSQKVHQAYKYRCLECDRIHMELLQLAQLIDKSIIPAILHVPMFLLNCSCLCFKNKSSCFTEIIIQNFFIRAFFHLMPKLHTCLPAGKQCLHISTTYVDPYDLQCLQERILTGTYHCLFSKQSDWFTSLISILFKIFYNWKNTTMAGVPI